MRLRRGATIVEMAIAMVMIVVLMTATTTLYAYSTKKVGAQAAESALQMQVALLASEINKFVSQAKNCQVVMNGDMPALVCEMPALGTDEDFDGVNEHFTPNSSDGGKEVYNTGFYVWFYMSDSSGTWGNAGNEIWRAVVTNPGPPSPADVDDKWRHYYGGAYRWGLIDSIAFTNDPINQLTTFTINGSSLNRADRSALTDPNAPGRRLSYQNTVWWQNFRNMVVNGGFEYPDVSGAGWGYFSDDGLTNGWIKTSTTPFEIQFGGFGAQSFKGKQHLELDGDVPGSAKQTLNTVPGSQYSFSFFYTPRPGCADNKIEVKWNGSTIDILDGNGVGLPGSAAWTQKTYVVSATAATTDIEFIDESASGDKTGGLLDNVVVMPK